MNPIEQWLLGRIKNKGLTLDDSARTRISEASAQAQRELDAQGESTVDLPALITTPQGPVHVEVEAWRGGGSTEYKIRYYGAGLPKSSPDELMAQHQQNLQRMQASGGGVPIPVIIILSLSVGLLISLFVIGMFM